MVSASPALLGDKTLQQHPTATLVSVVIDGRPAGTIMLDDPIKATTPDAIAGLHGLGLRVVMVTGDRETTAWAVARSLRLDGVHAGVTPARKQELVREHRAAGEIVIFAGDGINDAPALAQADLGIAMGSGTDIAMEAGGIVLMRGDLNRVADALELSRRTMRIIRQNLFWAFAYNAVGIPVAALGLLSPMVASAAMALSSVTVVTNSLRLK